MSEYPTKIAVNLRRARKGGLLIAVSDDLPGLMTVARTVDEIDERLPDAIRQIIKAQYGADVTVELLDNEDARNDFPFLSDPRVLELHAA